MSSHSFPITRETSGAGQFATFIAAYLGYFIILYIYTSVDYFVFASDQRFLPAYEYYALIIAALVLSIWSRSGIAIIRYHWRFVLVLLFFLLFISVQRVFYNLADSVEVREAYIEKVQFVTVTLAALVIFQLHGNFQKLLGVLRFVVLVTCAINIVEFFLPSILPWQMSAVPGRAAGFFVNPNGAATFIASPLPLLMIGMPVRRRLLYYAVTAMGVFLTFSRGGWVLWLFAALITEGSRFSPDTFRFTRNKVSGAAAALIGLIVVGIAFQATFSLVFENLSPFLDSNTSTRLQIIANDTVLDRLELARQGWIAFLNAPIFGNGVGYTWGWTYGASVHNMFILILAEQGLVGLTWLVTFLATLWSYGRPYGWAIVGIFIATAMSTHNYFDGPSYGFIVALYLIAALKNQRDGNSSPFARKHSVKSFVRFLR